MGSINLKHTGSGSAIALSSDGTDLLLNGSAIGSGGGGAFEFIASSGAISAGTASVVFSSSHFNASNYRNYVFKFGNVKIQTDNYYLQMHVSYDNGSNYDTNNIYKDGASAASMKNHSQLTTNGLGTATGESGLSGDMLMYNPHETSAYTYFQTLFAYMNGSGSLYRENGIREQLHYIQNTSSINNIKISVGSGNFASGYIDMYGIKKS